MRLLSLLAALAVGCTSPMAGAPGGDSLAARADAGLRQLEALGFVGSVLVACDDRVVFARDYGLPRGERRTPSYWVASISKQFTAAAVLQLAEQGRLRLDDPLSRYFADAPVDKARITLRQLATHQSGIGQAYAADGVIDRDEAARAILAGQLAKAPGAGFSYANDNFALLAMVVEIVSGQRFEDYVRANLFEPAGLTEAGFWPEAGDDYVPPLLAPLDGPVSRANWGFRGGTGMRASVRDLYAWTQALDHGVVASPASAALLYGPHVTVSANVSHGLGWFWTNEKGGRWLWTRGSESYGSNAVVYRLWQTPLTIIAATNAGPAESAGPGWSRRARDTLQEVYTAAACPRQTVEARPAP